MQLGRVGWKGRLNYLGIRAMSSSPCWLSGVASTMPRDPPHPSSFQDLGREDGSPAVFDPDLVAPTGNSRIGEGGSLHPKEQGRQITVILAG